MKKNLLIVICFAFPFSNLVGATCNTSVTPLLGSPTKSQWTTDTQISSFDFKPDDNVVIVYLACNDAGSYYIFNNNPTNPYFSQMFAQMLTAYSTGNTVRIKVNNKAGTAWDSDAGNQGNIVSIWNK